MLMVRLAPHRRNVPVARQKSVGDGAPTGTHPAVAALNP
jgi:hypothetical protein